MSGSLLRRVLGRPPIHPALFALSKLALVVSAGYLVAGLLGAWRDHHPLPVARPLAMALAGLGALIPVIALGTLGEEARVGLPRGEETELRDEGLYRLSRHPVYVGVFLICAAAVLQTGQWGAVASGFVACVLHHRIALAEEEFLAERFGRAWEDYARRTRRYL